MLRFNMGLDHFGQLGLRSSFASTALGCHIEHAELWYFGLEKEAVVFGVWRRGKGAEKCSIVLYKDVFSRLMSSMLAA